MFFPYPHPALTMSPNFSKKNIHSLKSRKHKISKIVKQIYLHHSQHRAKKNMFVCISFITAEELAVSKVHEITQNELEWFKVKSTTYISD